LLANKKPLDKVMDTKTESVVIVTQWQKLKSSDYSFSEMSDILFSAGKHDQSKDTPNWDRDGEWLFAGCHARIWASQANYHNGTEGNYFQEYGPDVTYGKLDEYEKAAKALKTIAKRMADIYESRGNPIDAAEHCGRWLESIRVKTVWIAPERTPNGRLPDDGWRKMSIGSFVSALRGQLAVKGETAESVAA
jgi:hypothetical protein